MAFYESKQVCKNNTTCKKCGRRRIKGQILLVWADKNGVKRVYCDRNCLDESQVDPGGGWANWKKNNPQMRRRLKI